MISKENVSSEWVNFTIPKENDTLREKILIDLNKSNDNINNENKKNMSINQIHKFINKLKNTNVTDLEKSDFKNLLDDIKNLNISKYLSEILNYIFNLTYHVNKYSDIFLLINIIKYINKNYSNVDELIENIAFTKFFKLDENDKNYFFIIFHDLYNNIDENNMISKNINVENCPDDKNSNKEKLPDLVDTNNTENNNNDKKNREINNIKNLKELKELKGNLFKKLNSYICKDNQENDNYLFEYDLFASDKNIKFQKKSSVDKKAYMIEMLNDNNLMKKIEKKNKLRKILLCMYFELILFKICKNKDLLLYMFLNITFFFTLKFDFHISYKDKINNSEKKELNYPNNADILSRIKKYLIVNTVITFDYFFTNTNTLFIDENLKKKSENVDKKENLNKEENDIVLSINNNNSVVASYVKYINDIKDNVMKFFKAFYHCSMYNLLIYLYTEHVVNEYSSDNKKSSLNEEYEFFKIYEKSKNFCKFFNVNKFSLDEIQIKGIDLLGLKEESFNHIKIFDNIKNKNEKEKEIIIDESNTVWNNDEEKSFYTNFPDYSNINICLNDDDCDDDDINLNYSNENNINDMPNNQPNNINNVKKDREIDERAENKVTNDNSKKEKSSEKKIESKHIISVDNKKNVKNIVSGNSKEKMKEFSNYLEKIINMNNEKDVEDFVMIFLLNYNTKKKRKIIANTIIHINKISLNLIPYYCRYIAIINKYVKDIYITIIDELKRITEKIIKEKLPCQNKKTKCIKYACELTKFKLLDLSYILDIINLLIENFTSDHAELCFFILENCSLLLLNNSKTHIRFLNLLQKLKKIKNSKNLPSSLELVFEECCIKIDNFITRNNITKKKISKYSEEDLKKKYFLKKLLFQDIESMDTEIICKYIRKFNWNDKLITHCLKKYIFNYLMYMSIYQINNLASLLFNLAKYKPFFVTQIIDELYERIITILENNDFKKYTFLIQYTHLFAELYNYKIFNSSNVFDLLYFLISIADIDIFNSHHISSIYKVFKDNKTFIESIRSNIPNLNKKENGITAGLESKNNNINNKNDVNSRNCNKYGKNTHNSDINKEEFFSYDDYDDNFYKFLFINKRNPIFYHIFHDVENNSFINIKMICIIIESCSRYFHTPLLSFKLNKFFLFFLRFLLLLEPLPIYIKNITDNIIEKNSEEMKNLKTIKDIDKYLFKILNAEYKIHLNQINKNSKYSIMDSDLSFSIEKCNKTKGLTYNNDCVKANKNISNNEEEYDKMNDLTKQEKRNTSSIYENKNNKNYNSKERKARNNNSSKLRSKKELSNLLENDDIEYFNSSSDENSRKVKTMENELDEEINEIINASIKENRLSKNKVEPVNFKNFTIYSNLLNKKNSKNKDSEKNVPIIIYKKEKKK
ncbi:conserved Plasmodium protein, unknown function [Plasmodium relictum]|uniref:Armadillo repeat protein n=1 Tax=Plasmodium relictum TaxID=85471 RepID=A0A1J1H3I8_PLARL|nr:conserved Plasmodium protein, unknown function [Plasmodium relictum]CRG99469.1 conserved Plasmodium protein, unknown function [Plasmodium relictum]